MNSISDTICDSEVTSEQIQQLADEVCQRGYKDLVIFFLEAHRPLRGLAYQVGIFSMPLLSLFFRSSKLSLLLHIMESDMHLQMLLEALEDSTIEGSKRS